MKRAAEIPTSQLLSETQEATNDLSVLRRPIKTSVNGLNEARKAYEDGTEEIQRLLANECDIIYECKVCRNMFRSLANLISHKRIYCKTTYSASLQFNFNNGNGFSHDSSTIVQSDSDFVGSTRNGKNSEKDLCSIIDRLVRRENTNRCLKLSDYYEQVNKKLTQDEMLRQKSVLHLDVVPESKVAVYQTVKSSDDTNDTIKSEVTELHDLANNNPTVLGPDGKIVDSADLPPFPLDIDKLSQAIECEICHSKFATEKTLTLHIENRHIPSTNVFQCPTCSQVFRQVGQVIRHLTNDHKKSMKRVRLMRDSIFKRRVRIDEVQAKGPNRELARLQIDKHRVDAPVNNWHEENENGTKNENICVYCNQKFDRKAVLLSHHKMCQQKKKPNTRVSLARKKTQEKPSNTNGWNDRDYDDSSNSNSLEAVSLGDGLTMKLEKSGKTEREIKTEMDPEVSESTTSNRRKKSRAMRVVLAENANESEDDKSLNTCWNTDSSFKVKVELPSPVDDSNLTDSGSNNTSETDTQLTAGKIEEPATEEKQTRTTNGSGLNSRAMKSKFTSSHCKHCFKKFSNASNLRRHISMSHFGPKKFTCNLCKFDARRKTEMITHMRTKHQFDSDKMDVSKYISSNDEQAPKPTGSISMSRRKDKHTEVLQDDEAEIFIETEPLPADEIGSQMQLLDTSNENSNTETEEPPTASETIEMTNLPLKRKGRPKTKDKTQRNEHLQSTDDRKESGSITTRRPVRNRTMPVKKDFVYDLSTLLKKDHNQIQIQQELQKQTLPLPPTHASPEKSRNSTPITNPLDNNSRTSKRRLTTTNAGETATPDSQSQSDVQTKDEPNSLPSKEEGSTENNNNSTEEDANHIKGAADAMAQRAVEANRAVFFKVPDILGERPVVTPQRQFSTNALKHWPILKRTPAMHGNKLHGIKHKKRSCLMKYASNSNSLLRKSHIHDSKMRKANENGHRGERAEVNNSEHSNLEPVKIVSQIADKMKLHFAKSDDGSAKTTKQDGSSSNESSSPSKSVVDVASVGTPRRMTLLERLAENKTKKLNESLSRMTIANSDNDSDGNSD